MNGNGRVHHRVAVTGIGVITPIGTGVREFWGATLAGKIGTKSITRFDPSQFNSHVAAQVDDFDPKDYFSDAKRLRRTDRFAQFSVAASRLALEDAGYHIERGTLDKFLNGTGLNVVALSDRLSQ